MAKTPNGRSDHVLTISTKYCYGFLSQTLGMDIRQKLPAPIKYDLHPIILRRRRKYSYGF